jgi:hypothetical protein
VSIIVKENMPNSEVDIICNHAGAHKAREISELRAEIRSIKAMLI